MIKKNQLFLLALTICGVLLSLPALMGPGRALRYFPGWWQGPQLVFGLDLQGGAHLLLEVDKTQMMADHYDLLAGSLRKALRKKGCRYANVRAAESGIKFELVDEGSADHAYDAVRSLDSELVITRNGKSMRVALPEEAVLSLLASAQEKSMETIRRRVDESGTKEPLIQTQGRDRIVLQVPGADSPERVKELVGRTARLSFQLVKNVLALDEAQSFVPNPSEEILFPVPSSRSDSANEDNIAYVVDREVLVSGSMLVDAQPSFDQYNQPQVSFKLNGLGAELFGAVTQKNTGRPFAIVLDSEVISAPRINEPILGGQGVISGRFSIQEAQDLSLLMRSGALPAPLTVLEERVIGPGLGADSIQKGTMATAVAIVVVVAIMFAAYHLFGTFASIALIVNFVLLLGAMAYLGATLTLPGIAGIALTLGMAVDANVLINERIKEEMRAGRSLIAALDMGYQRAMTTIVDSNLTTLIGAFILYVFGSGPVRGFAVTLSIGILISMFTAVLLSRAMAFAWIRYKRPKVLWI